MYKASISYTLIRMDFVEFGSVFLFTLGVAVQLFVTVWGKMKKGDLLGLMWILIFVSLATIFVQIKSSYRLIDAVTAFVLMSAVVISVFFRDKILPVVNEINLVVLMISFWYLFITRVGLENGLTLIMLIPTIFALIIGVIRVRLHFVVKVLLYLWSIILAIGISQMVVPLGEIFTIISNISSYGVSASATTSSFDIFFAGMMYFYVSSYILFLIFFIPLPSKHQSIRERIQVFKEDSAFAASRFSEYQFPPHIVLLLIIFCSALLYINALYKVVDDSLILSLILATASLIGSKLHKPVLKN